MKRILYSIVIGICLSLPAQAQTVADQLREAQNLTVFARLVAAVGLNDTLNAVRDEIYEEYYLTGKIQDLPRHPTESNVWATPAHRYYGFTVFAETDDVWEQNLGKRAQDISVADVEQWTQTQGTTLRQFVTYHILPVNLPPHNLVIHHNEHGYDYRTSTSPTIFTAEHYETLGEGRRLMRLSEGGGVEGVYLNRCPVLDNGRKGTYYEAGTPLVEGIRVDTAGVAALNGHIYAIPAPLLYTQEVRMRTLGGRIRYDVSALFPELMNNGLRANKQQNMSCGLPCTSVYRYCDGLDIQDGTLFYYLTGQGYTWANWQGDEFNVIGLYDFTMKLPPVPNDGAYELRIATNSDSSNRGIAQFFFGSDKDNLQPAGLPIDMREGGQYIQKPYSPGGNTPSRLGWEADTGDDVYDRSVDLRLYEMGAMKAPANCDYYYSRPLRAQQMNLRRIVWRGYVKAGETYYLRVRTTMEESDIKQCYLDYLEWCPKEVYANPIEPEDIW